MRVPMGPVGTSVADLQRAVDLQERSEPISLSRTVTVCARAGRTEAVTVANNNRRRRCISHQPPCMMRGRVVQAYLRSGSGTYRRTGRKRCQIWACDKDIRCQKTGLYECHACTYRPFTGQFWYWAIACIAGVICEAKASSWERQQRRISEIETKQD